MVLVFLASIFIRNYWLMFKQVSFYLLLNIVIVMIVLINPYVAGVSSMIIHVVAILFGIINAVFYRKIINDFFNVEDSK